MRKIGGQETEKNVLVDGGNLYHRASNSINDPSSVPSFLARFLTILNDYRSEIGEARYILFFDGKPTRRKTIFPDYKENRSGRVRILPDVVRECIEMVGYLGIDAYYNVDEEADDLIYTFLKEHSENVNVVVSDDKDFYPALLNPRTILYRPSVKPHFYDRERAEEHINSKISGHKLKLEQYRLFKALCGDSSDNIKGVFRLRKNVATRLASDLDFTKFNYTDVDYLTENEKSSCHEAKDRIILNVKLIDYMHVDNLENNRIASSYELSRFREFIKKLNLPDARYGRLIRSDRVGLPDWLNDL